MIPSCRSRIPSKGSTRRPKSSSASDQAIALMVKSRRRWSSSSVPASTCGLRESRPTNTETSRIAVEFEHSNTLEDAGVRGLLVRGRSTLAIDTSKVECDCYNFLRGDRSTISSYRGEYMTQYSWAEVTRSALRQQAAASQKGGLPSYYVPPTGF